MAKFKNQFYPEGNINDDAATTSTDRASQISLLKGILGKLVTPTALTAGTAMIGAVKDAGPNWTKAHTHVASADASAGVDLSAAPTATQKIVLVGLTISTTTALTITVEEETSGTDLLVFVVAASSQPIVLDNLFIKLATADKKLILKTSGAGQIYATATYFSEA